MVFRAAAGKRVPSAGASLEPGIKGFASVNSPQRGNNALPDTKGRLFQELVRSIDRGKRLTVLEIGAARPETVDFFSQFRCQLFFADLFSAPFLADQQQKLSRPKLQAQFRRALDLPKGLKFDLCLFWNVFQFLTGPAIRSLCGELESHVHKDTQAHALGVHSAGTACKRAHYAIRDSAHFKPVAKDFPELPYFPHPQAELGDLLDIFKVDRAMLLGDGTVEMLLSTKPFWD